MNKAVFTFAALLALTTGAGAAVENELPVRCDGLFLLKQDPLSASAYRCDASDTAARDAFSVYAAFQKTHADLSWKDSWKATLKTDIDEGVTGVRGDFSFLSLGARIEGNGDSYWNSDGIVWKLPDSLVYIGAGLGAGKVKLASFRWVAGSTEGLLDTLQGDWEAQALQTNFSIGSKVNGHHRIYAEVSRTESDRVPVGNDSYVFRDSSELYSARALYTYESDNRRAQIAYRRHDADLRLFGVRHEDESTKRFFYLPLEAHYQDVIGTFHASGWDFDAGFGDASLKMPAKSQRFYETLAPNRMLSYSLAQALSFTFYQKSYRLSGKAEGYWTGASIGYHRNLTFHGWGVSPRVRLDAFTASGNADITRKDEATELFSTASETHTYEGRAKIVATQLALGSRFESPHGMFFADLSAGHLVPLLYHKRFTETTNEASTGSSQDRTPGAHSVPLSSLFLHNGLSLNAAAGVKF